VWGHAANPERRTTGDTDGGKRRSGGSNGPERALEVLEEVEGNETKSQDFVAAPDSCRPAAPPNLT